MAKKVVRAEVYGPEDGNNCCAFLLGLIERMEHRQDRWHAMPPSYDFPKDGEGNALMKAIRPVGSMDGSAGDGHGAHAGGEGEHLCLKMLAGTRRMLEAFDWE